MQTATSLKTLAVRYIEAAGDKNYDAVREVLAPDVEFRGPFATMHGPAAFIAALKRMAPVWVRSTIRDVLADEDKTAVFYDFVTDTEAGNVPCIELLTFAGDRIKAVDLFFDRQAFAPASQALAARTATK